MIVNGNVEVEEQEVGTYVGPSIDPEKQAYTWGLYVFKDGSAQLYTRRGYKGAFLGKPIKLSAPGKKPFCEHDLDLNMKCKHCDKVFRRVR